MDIFVCCLQLPSKLFVGLLPSFAMARASKRATPDPLVSVGDIQKVFGSFCKKEGSWDLNALLFKSNLKKTWKNAPDASFLAGPVSELCMELFKVTRNGVFASKKIRLALEKLQKEIHRLNFTRHHDGDFFDMVDQQVRIACSMFRDLKASPTKYATCMRKASVSEKEKVDGVLQHLVVTDVCSEVGVSSDLPQKPEEQKVDKSPESPKKTCPSSSGSCKSRFLMPAALQRASRNRLWLLPLHPTVPIHMQCLPMVGLLHLTRNWRQGMQSLSVGLL